MTVAAAALEVIGLELRFGGVTALAGVSFTADPGELLAVIGPNGAGKTAILNCINGVYHPTSDRMYLDGVDISRLSLHQAARRGIARSFQHVELFAHLSVADNIMLGRHSLMSSGALACLIYGGRAKREELRHREKAEEIIDFFELNRYRDQVVTALPYGLQKLVSVARAVAMEPRLLLLDEPSTGLMREEKEQLARFLLRIRHEHAPTIVWVEHDMEMVGDLSDRVVVLSYGEKIADGPVQEVRSNPAVIESYIGVPSPGPGSDYDRVS